MDADGDGDVAKSGFFGSLDADSIEGALNPETLTILGMLPSQGVVEPWIWMVSACCKAQDADSVRDAVKAFMLMISGMLQSPGQ